MLFDSRCTIMLTVKRRCDKHTIFIKTLNLGSRDEKSQLKLSRIFYCYLLLLLPVLRPFLTMHLLAAYYTVNCKKCIERFYYQLSREFEVSRAKTSKKANFILYMGQGCLCKDAESIRLK